ncbi:uncharacterized protein CCHa1 [Ochlerotatus camptorhynchus]|uniref:uncharacterized protein CCHa1 n=1 Tax=Ochlerotatus camptorhynchus TaxID=644619 RepID=UPI0031DD78B8
MKKMGMISGIMSCRVKMIGAVFLVICCCFSYAKGGCLSYGHSCWGGHGKRSGPPSGRSMTRSIPAPPMAPSDLWPAIERMKPPGGKGPLYAAPNSVYYQQLGRMFKVPPVSIMDLVGPDSSSSSNENDDNSSKTDDDENNGDSSLENHNALRSREDQLRQRQLRRKAALFETATAGAGSSNEDDIGQLLLDAAASNRDNQNLFKLLNSPPPRKFERGT